MNDSIKEYRSRLTKNGVMTLLTALLLLAVLILSNVLVGALPSYREKIDMTENKMYSVSQDTQRKIAKIDQKISIYLLASGGQSGLVDQGFQLDAFLANAAAVNKNISYSVVDPLTETEWLQSSAFANESLGNFSIIVESNLRYRHIPFSDVFSYYIDQVGKVSENDSLYYYYYYGLEPYYIFDGESALLGALSYVTNENVPTVYTVSSHSETALSSTLSTQISTSGIDVKSTALTSAIPSDCALLILNVPQTDLTTDEISVLSEYVYNGGCVFLTTTPEIESFVNLCSFTESMGLIGKSGIVIEQNSGYYNSYPYYLVPQNAESDLITSGSQVLLPFAHEIATANVGTTITKLFTTSASAYMVATNSASAEKPEDAEERSFCIGAVAENGNGGRLIWISSYTFLDDSYNQAAGGGNYALLTNAITHEGATQEKAPTADFLPMITPRLTVEAGASGILSVGLIIVLPAVILVVGALYVLKRKKR